MRIRGEALELAFRVVLSCPCPVTAEQEARVFDHLRGLTADEVADYAPVLDVFDTTDTPFHGLAAFTSWTADDGDPVIERHHVLRCNASSYHWEVAAATLSGKSRTVSSISAYLLSHTILPVTLVAGEPGELEAPGEHGSPRALYRYGGGAAAFDNIFLPPEYDPSSAALWAFHLGAVLSPLTDAEAALVSRLGEANDQLVLHRGRVACVDYADFELQGDYAGFCRRRHARYWGGA
ncbi:MAG TPA: hypothetical protein VMH50_09450 [Thermoleophilia bacterium]|nr:hypothetical protein [Thermoleophilia bacterium]